jgi:hypothetical protein
LILARHSLICSTIELESTLEAHSIVRAAREAASVDDEPQPSGVSRDRAARAELMLLPELIVDLEAAIAIGWKHLARTSSTPE